MANLTVTNNILVPAVPALPLGTVNYSREYQDELNRVLRLYFHAGAESLRVMHSFVFDGDEHKDFLRGLGNDISHIRRQFAQHFVGQRRRFLLGAECADQREGHALASDIEVLQAALGLPAPIAVDGHFDGAHGIGLGAGRHEASLSAQC